MAWLSFTELDKAVVHVIRLVSFLIVVSVSLPSDALFERLLSYWGFSYLGHGVFLSLPLKARDISKDGDWHM